MLFRSGFEGAGQGFPDGEPLIPYLRKCEAIQLLEVLVFLELVGFFDSVSRTVS